MSRERSLEVKSAGHPGRSLARAPAATKPPEQRKPIRHRSILGICIMPIANQQKVFWLLPVVAMLLMVFPALGYAQSTRDTKNIDDKLREEIAKSESEVRARPNDLNLLYQLATLYHQHGDYAKSVPCSTDWPEGSPTILIFNFSWGWTCITRASRRRHWQP